MSRVIVNILCLYLFSAVCFAGTGSQVNWSMRYSRNMASDAKNLPFELTSSNVVWKIRTGSHQYTVPVIDGDRVYVGVNDSTLYDSEKYKSTRGSILLCVERKTGKEIWRHVVPRFAAKKNARRYHFNVFNCGICSSPVVDGERLYIVSPDGVVVCLDRNGMKDGNTGPFKGENELLKRALNRGKELDEGDGDVIWRYDLIEELNVFPHDVCGSTVLLHKGKLYVCTSNGVALSHREHNNTSAPSLIVLDAATGKLLAVADEKISEGTFHGQWSSPSLGTVDGRELIFFGGGDGKCYAFEPLTKKSDKLQKLKRVWVTDCNPKSYRFNADGSKAKYSIWSDRTPKGPCEIIGSVVLEKGKLYAVLGQSPYHGRGAGMLTCMDPATGKIIWKSDLVKRSTATVAVADGLLYISDYSGQMHCFDAETGKRCWVHDLEGDVWCASPAVADGKVYIGTSRRDMWIFEAGREKKVLGRVRLKSVPISVVPVDGALYVPTQRALTVYK